MRDAKRGKRICADLNKSAIKGVQESREVLFGGHPVLGYRQPLTLSGWTYSDLELKRRVGLFIFASSI